MYRFNSEITLFLLEVTHWYFSPILRKKNTSTIYPMFDNVMFYTMVKYCLFAYTDQFVLFLYVKIVIITLTIYVYVVSLWYHYVKFSIPGEVHYWGGK